MPDYQTRQESRTLTTRSKSRGINRKESDKEAKRLRYTAVDGKRKTKLGKVEVLNKFAKNSNN